MNSRAHPQQGAYICHNWLALRPTLGRPLWPGVTYAAIVTTGVTDEDGAQGLGYTYTTGHNGGAVADALRREIPDLVTGEDADRIEHLWNKVWWGLHYGGRGGPVVLALSAFDIALWDLKARRAGLPLYRLLGGFDPKVPCYAGGIDLDLSPQALVDQRCHAGRLQPFVADHRLCLLQRP